jgi:hypothetical protein
MIFGLGGGGVFLGSSRQSSPARNKGVFMRVNPDMLVCGDGGLLVEDRMRD